MREEGETYDLCQFEYSSHGSDVTSVELTLSIIGNDLNLRRHVELDLLRGSRRGTERN